ncbi:MAG: DUF551 domain-containing protein [Hyphomicrobiales bacterium]|nr:MAG: DUF551 domain-containing protein [Hyphomicrobiales bacterium]
MGWQAIKTAPRDGTPILLGHWFDDTAGGYFGEPRWLWQSSGSIDDEGIWLELLDDHIKPIGFHTVTHWMPLPAPPPSCQDSGKD